MSNSSNNNNNNNNNNEYQQQQQLDESEDEPASDTSFGDIQDTLSNISYTPDLYPYTPTPDLSFYKETGNHTAVPEEGEADVESEYQSYKSLIEKIAKSNGNIIVTYEKLVKGCPVFAFTDGKMWVGDKTGIKVCELTTGEVQTRMGNDTLRCIVIVEDEAWAGYCNGDIIVYDTKSPEKILKRTKEQHEITCIAYSDGDRGNGIWTSACDWEVRTRRRVDGTQIRNFAGHQSKVRSIVAFNNYVWTAADDSNVFLWNKKGEREKAIELKKAKCGTLCIVGNLIWGGCSDGLIRVWDVEGNPIRAFRAHRSTICSLVNVGTHVWSASGKSIKIWSRATFSMVEELRTHYPISTMSVYGIYVFIGGINVVQIRLGTGLLEWLRNHIDNLREHCKLLDIQLEETLEKMRELLGEYEIFKDGSADQLATKVAELRQQITKLEEKLEEMNKENQMIAKLKDKADETIQQMDEINTKLVQELREKSRTLRNNTQQESTIQSLQENTTQQKQQIQEQQTALDNLQQQKDDLQQQREDLRLQRDDLHHQIDDLHVQNEDLRHQRDDLQQQREDLRHQIEDLRTQISDLHAQANDIRAQRDSLQKKLDEIEKRSGLTNVELQDSLKALEMENTILKEQHHKLEAENTKLQGDTHKLQTEVTLSAEAVEKLEDDLKEKEEIIYKLRAQVSKANFSSEPIVKLIVEKEPTPISEKCAVRVIFVLCIVLFVLLFVLLRLSVYRNDFSHLVH